MIAARLLGILAVTVLAGLLVTLWAGAVAWLVVTWWLP